MAKAPRRIPILKAIPLTKTLALLVHHTKIKGAVAEAEGEAAGAEVAQGPRPPREKKVVLHLPQRE
jgi:hypothetical protein